MGRDVVDVLCDGSARMALKNCTVLSHLQDLGYDPAASLIGGDLSRDLFWSRCHHHLFWSGYDGRSITFVPSLSNTLRLQRACGFSTIHTVGCLSDMRRAEA